MPVSSIWLKINGAPERPYSLQNKFQASVAVRDAMFMNHDFTRKSLISTSKAIIAQDSATEVKLREVQTLKRQGQIL